ncbi:UvrD-helicase domain-containing protein [Algoriphagus halophilus]|uniref:UvrD-helicase domain-containing protein n=1 Tax=Algoriphagus halophilus TaxID=226505 RepID=UPI003590158F
MDFIIDKKVKTQLAGLMKRGGHYQKAAETVKRVFGDIALKSENPLASLKTTNHGETRIKNVVKYDLNGFCRLITVQKDNTCFIKFLGDHNECHSWLEGHKGFNIGVDEGGELKDFYVSDDITSPDTRVNNESDYSNGLLVSKLGNQYLEILFEGLPNLLKKIFEGFDSLVEEDDILETCELASDKKRSELLFDTFIQLRAGDVDSAKNRILYFRDEIKVLDSLPNEDLGKIKSNDEYLRFDDMEPEDLKILMDNKSWHEWMLFMHPAQRRVVEMDFSGPARLLGVSGSGKTAIIVKRALRLAKKYPGEKILVLTLNRSLASLINNLVSILLDCQPDKEELESQIKVTSFWEYCRFFLIENADSEMNKKIYDDFVHKHNDSIEDEWEAFYQCKNNNNDAEVLFNLHKSLLSRGVYPQSYIKQEFDWIRSAFSLEDRIKYLEIEREGRHIPLGKDSREDILKALASWEEYMSFVGVTDYLGLSQSILKHLDKINSTYRCVLVDEMQDFGTIELLVIRKLCEENENDLFLSGDIAQVVHTKHHKITLAGIKIAGQNYLKITKNYRNSREILAAAYDVFNKSVDIDSYTTGDFEILHPEYANFSSPKPFLRKTSSLSNGFNFSLTYLKGILDEKKDEKGCIAICGYSYYDVLEIGSALNIPVLDGKMDLSMNSIFLSDLENTKGFEFDRMILINCNEGIIPNPDQPKEEWFRDISKLYVAMTRAKRELVVSFNEKVSSVFDRSLDFFTSDSWTDHVEINAIGDFEIPEPKIDIGSNGYQKLLGKEFLYTHKAIGLSSEAQQKLIDVVNGTHTTDQKNKILAFRSIGNLKVQIESRARDLPQLTKLFGPVVFPEIEDRLKEEF